MAAKNIVRAKPGLVGGITVLPSLVILLQYHVEEKNICLYVDGNFFVHHNSGKSIVLAEICRQAISEWGGRVLVLAHVKELVEQNTAKLRQTLPAGMVGIHSAGLKKRDYFNQVIAAGIQSVYRKACDLGRFDMVIIDEAHLLPPGDDGEGMYRSFLADAKIINPALRVVGLTATPYRMSSGEICGPENVLNHVCYEGGVRDLIEAGYLSPLVSKGGARKADVSGLHIRGGEFIAGEAEDLMDADELVKSAVAEIVEATRDRKACLIFCAGIKHAAHVVKIFRDEHGIECGFIEGGTPSGERARLISRFRGELQQQALFAESLKPLKYLANVGVLTTGFDAPGTDCVALLRPTASAGLFCQMLGRGFRLAPGKENCLILDFAENLVRHGPVDMIKAGDRPNKGVPGEAPARECPKCRRICHASIHTCPECGFEFPRNEKPKHNAHASDAPVVSGDADAAPREFEVLETSYGAHEKRNAPPGHPPSMRVSHRIGGYDNWISEWVCPQHAGYAREKFVDWWAKRSHYPPPHTVRDAVAMAHEGCLASTNAIRVKQDANGYDRIIAWALGEKPDVDRGLLEAIHHAPVGDPWPVGDPEIDAVNSEINFDDIPF